MGETVAVGDGVELGVAVTDGLPDAVAVSVTVRVVDGVLVGVSDGDGVDVAVGVCVGLAVGDSVSVTVASMPLQLCRGFTGCCLCKQKIGQAFQWGLGGRGRISKGG